MANGGNGKVWDDFSISVNAIDPESDYVVDFTWINEFYPGAPSLATTVIYRDASGQWWRCHGAEPIEDVHDDPGNMGPTPTERVRIRRQQVAMGFDPMAEHNVSHRVRWHRFMREPRGKSPLP